MITKESLIEEREQVNDTVLKIKQKYSKSPSSKILYIIVEGKDDIAYYGIKAENYKLPDWKVQIIPAGNRNKVVNTYKQLNWNNYSKSRIFFIVDRDLSDYTGEETPIDQNIYITDHYSIENDVCTESTFIKILKYFANLNEMDSTDETELSQFYRDLEKQFYDIVTPVMALILYWKRSGIKANYANINFNNMFEFDNSNIKLHSNFNDLSDALQYVHLQSNVLYDDSIDLEKYEQDLLQLNTPIHFVRGKYLTCFFSSIINYAAQNSQVILSSKKESKLSLTIGSKNVISSLCGYMDIPMSLHNFLTKLQFNENIV